MLDNLLLFPTVVPFVLLLLSAVLMLISIVIPIEHAFHGADTDVSHVSDGHDIDADHSGIMAFLGFKDRVPVVLALFILSILMCLISYFVTPYIMLFGDTIGIILGIVLLIVNFLVSCRITAFLLKPIAIFIRNNSGTLLELVGSVGEVKYVSEKKKYVVLKLLQGGVDTELNVYFDDVSNIVKGDKVVITDKKKMEVTGTEVYVGKKVEI